MLGRVVCRWCEGGQLCLWTCRFTAGVSCRRSHLVFLTVWSSISCWLPAIVMLITKWHRMPTFCRTSAILWRSIKFGSCFNSLDTHIDWLLNVIIYSRWLQSCCRHRFLLRLALLEDCWSRILASYECKWGGNKWQFDWCIDCFVLFVCSIRFIHSFSRSISRSTEIHRTEESN